MQSRLRNKTRFWAILLVLASLSACVYRQPINQFERQPSARCGVLVESLEREIAAANVRDGQYAIVKGYPLFRVNRLLAAQTAAVVTAEQRLEWLRLASENAIESYLIEYENLPNDQKLQLAEFVDLRAVLQDCAWQASRGLAEPVQWLSFVDQVSVPSEYRLTRKILGLYPLTNLGMKAGISEWQQDTRELFNTNPEAQDSYVRWSYGERAANRQALSAQIGEVPSNALGMPMFTSNQWRSLASAFAPEWVIETKGDYDRPGRPLPGANFEPEPIVYWQTGYGRVHGQVLPQVSYVMWFSERPKEGAFDLLGGKLDGVVWRITLTRDDAGAWKPLMHDSIHPCGCYHLFFPTPQLAHCAVDESRESAFVPQAAPEKQFAIWVQSATHYVRRLAPAGQLTAQRYRLEPLDSLRMANENNLRLYNASGLVKASARLERLLLWTSGLESPGAMRQWGRHATAFSGERYFDEPDLFDKEFCLASESE